MRFLCAVAMALGFQGTALADSHVASPAQLPLGSKATQLLGGQLQLTLPVEMKLDETGRALPSGTTASWRDERRASLELDEARFTMVAYETYASMGTNFRAALLSDLRDQGVDVSHAKIQKVSLANKLVGFEIVPTLPKSSLDTNVLIYAAYVGSVDGTVQTLGFYVNADALPYALAWTSLARKIVRTATPGRTPIDLKAGDRTLSKMFSVAKPAGWATTMQIGTGEGDGPLVVHQLREVAPLGSTSSSCVLKVGGNGDAAERVAANSVTGNVLNTAVTWKEWDDSNVPGMSTVVENGWKTLPLEIECRASTKALLPRLRDMIGTLKRTVDGESK